MVTVDSVSLGLYSDEDVQDASEYEVSDTMICFFLVASSARRTPFGLRGELSFRRRGWFAYPV